MCIRDRVITEQNLPLPLFLHRDDQEYGARTEKKVIGLNGICIWLSLIHIYCRFRNQYRVSDFTIWDCFHVGRFSKELDNDKGATRDVYKRQLWLSVLLQ